MGENLVCLQLGPDGRWVVRAADREPVHLSWCASAEHALQHAHSMFPDRLVFVTSKPCTRLFGAAGRSLVLSR